MTEEQKLILWISFLLVSLISLLIVFFITRKRVKKEKEMVELLEKETYNYYQILELKDNKYFPYFYTHGSGIRRDFKSKGDKDNITGIILNKNNRFFFDRILYIVNGKINLPLEKKVIDEQEYIVINDNIKTIELLVSFEKPSHFLIKYKVIKVSKDNYRVELTEVEDDDTRRNSNS